MINEFQIFKSGRTKKVFEVNDNLQVNDFYNETGYQKSSLHGRMSRIQIIIVDITKGKKAKAIVCSFNLKSTEWFENFKYLTNTDMFEKKYGRYGLSLTKANPHKKIGDMISVNQLKVTFEKGLKNPSWKFNITEGKAQPEDKFGYKKESFQKLKENNYILSISEVNEMCSYITKYINNWENTMFSEFLSNRSAFTERAKANNFDESSIKEWNKNPYPNSRRKHDYNNADISVEESVDALERVGNKEIASHKKDYKCQTCGCTMTKQTAEMMIQAFGKQICNACI